MESGSDPGDRERKGRGMGQFAGRNGFRLPGVSPAVVYREWRVNRGLHLLAGVLLVSG